MLGWCSERTLQHDHSRTTLRPSHTPPQPSSRPQARSHKSLPNSADVSPLFGNCPCLCSDLWLAATLGQHPRGQISGRTCRLLSANLRRHRAHSSSWFGCWQLAQRLSLLLCLNSSGFRKILLTGCCREKKYGVETKLQRDSAPCFCTRKAFAA